jgi:hypothetical protein
LRVGGCFVEGIGVAGAIIEVVFIEVVEVVFQVVVLVVEFVVQFVFLIVEGVVDVVGIRVVRVVEGRAGCDEGGVSACEEFASEDGEIGWLG